MPFFNVESGEMRDADLYTETPDAIASSPMAPTPATGAAPPGPTVGRLTTATIAAMTAEQRTIWLEGNREARMDPRHPINDDRHPEHAAALAEFETMVMGGRPNPVLGTVHEGGRLREVDNELPDTYTEWPEAGVMANRPAQDFAMSLARNLGDECVPVVWNFLDRAKHLYASSDPPDDISLHQQFMTTWPTLAERQAIDGRTHRPLRRHRPVGSGAGREAGGPRGLAQRA